MKSIGMYYPEIDCPLKFEQIQRVLVIKLRHHGDVLLTSPVFQVLKNHYPHIEIDALVYQETKDMLLFHPAIENVFLIDKEWKKQGKLSAIKHEKKLLNALKNRKYDLIIHLTESWRGVWLTHWLKPRYSIVRRYPRRQSLVWKKSFSHHYSSPENNCRHTVEIHLDALRRLGLHPTKNECRLVLVPGQQAEDSISSKLDAIDKPLVVVHPTSRWFFKCWSEEKVAAVIDDMAHKGYQVILTAAPVAKELKMAEQIVALVKSEIINFAGQLTLKELAALIQKAKLFIGVDSVPMHIASAMQTPTVVLFGPSSENAWSPWMNQAEIITSKHTCRPCGQDGCGNSKVSDCLMEIQSQAVITAIENLLGD